MNNDPYHFDETHVVVVTGGGSGIGYAIAKAFDSLGATVVLNGRDEAKLADAAESMSPRVRPTPFDITRIDEFVLAQAVARSLKESERVGDIQFISSMAALFGIHYVASYTASASTHWHPALSRRR